MPGLRDILWYTRTVGRGSPVDARWAVVSQLATMARLGRRLAPKDSPRGLPDVVADPEYVDLGTAKVDVGDDAPDFELPLLDGGGTVRLSDLVARGPVALVFGSYT
jgi:hypothetical protein